ncbi:CLUMA_CG003533, isoform A [Clunio marinus]|uniref:CLUMA_CG003533, isoform A n=1 Tax=Clunio marinus TaxID=568069 RepID=A0A1J1HQM0_9DIPT|nr:CLUMA_CG003533, isoform A [Clunio marinus]
MTMILTTIPTTTKEGSSNKRKSENSQDLLSKIMLLQNQIDALNKENETLNKRIENLEGNREILMDEPVNNAANQPDTAMEKQTENPSDDFDVADNLALNSDETINQPVVNDDNINQSPANNVANQAVENNYNPLVKFARNSGKLPSPYV